MLYSKDKKTKVKRSYTYVAKVNKKAGKLRKTRRLGKTMLNGKPKNSGN